MTTTVGEATGEATRTTGAGISEETGEMELRIRTDGDADVEAEAETGETGTETEDIGKKDGKERLEVRKVAGPHIAIQARKDSIFSKTPRHSGVG